VVAAGLDGGYSGGYTFSHMTNEVRLVEVKQRQKTVEWMRRLGPAKREAKAKDELMMRPTERQTRRTCRRGGQSSSSLVVLLSCCCCNPAAGFVGVARGLHLRLLACVWTISHTPPAIRCPTATPCPFTLHSPLPATSSPPETCTASTDSPATMSTSSWPAV
jgi:hypothetical protein